LLLGVLVFSVSSLGLIPFWEGMKEVDMMNYYVGSLCMASHSHLSALCFGWHLWSMLRGVAFTLLIYEGVSRSLEWLCGCALSTPRRHARRLAFGLGFFSLDCLVKFCTLPAVRTQLFHNLVNQVFLKITRCYE
jgi:hypothetical protein